MKAWSLHIAFVPIVLKIFILIWASNAIMLWPCRVTNLNNKPLNGGAVFMGSRLNQRNEIAAK
jgi:hypothetical protein